jgi:hypothetical protein
MSILVFTSKHNSICLVRYNQLGDDKEKRYLRGHQKLHFSFQSITSLKLQIVVGLILILCLSSFWWVFKSLVTNSLSEDYFYFRQNPSYTRFM